MSEQERFPECPPELLPNGVSSSAFDPVTLRAAAEAHNRHPFDHEMRVKAWTVLYLLGSWAERDSLQAQVDEAREALDALVVLVKSEFPEDRSLAEIAEIWGPQVLTARQVEVLSRLPTESK